MWTLELHTTLGCYCYLFLSNCAAAKLGSNHLLEANVLLINQEKCSEGKIYGNVLDNSMLCAGHLQGGVDSCQVSRAILHLTVSE